MAEETGITLAAVLRGEEFEIFTRPERIIGEARAP
jgi:formate dehydrogenase assembly factor FdhD